LNRDRVTIKVNAFMPNEEERRRGIGPSVILADLRSPDEAMKVKIKGQEGDWCKDKGGHLAEFSETVLPSGFWIEQEGRDEAHYQIKGPIYQDNKATYEWAYRISAKARIRLQCRSNKAVDVLLGVPPCG